MEKVKYFIGRPEGTYRDRHMHAKLEEDSDILTSDWSSCRTRAERPPPS